MPLIEEDSHFEQSANDPESLEGRLLFAVPKSESTPTKIPILPNHHTNIVISQREDYYKRP
jgi:hypothetical protein